MQVVSEENDLQAKLRTGPVGLTPEDNSRWTWYVRVCAGKKQNVLMMVFIIQI